MSKKYATFDSEGILLLRFDNAVNVIPDDAMEIEPKLWARLVNETDALWRRSGEAVTKEPLPALTLEILSSNERDWRDTQVQATEWWVSRHRDEQLMQLATTITAEQFLELMSYRQKLRDWPGSSEFPNDKARPVSPAWLMTEAR